jgi:Patatin-like phospholipase
MSDRMPHNRRDMARGTPAGGIVQRIQRLLRVQSPEPLDLARVLELEDRHFVPPMETMQGSDADRLAAAIARCHERDRAALCLSGGGIRSASFAIGVMQGLARRNLISTFHYLSTVSGGGYAGSWLSAWLFHEAERIKAAGENQSCADSVGSQLGASVGGREPEALRHVREYSRYLDPQMGLFSADVWTLVATVARNLLANWLILLPMLAAMLLVPRVYYAILDLGAQNFELITADFLYDANWVIASLVVVLAGTAMTYAVIDLPKSPGPHRGQSAFLMWCLLPMSIATGLLGIYWAWNREVTGIPNSLSLLMTISGALHVATWGVCAMLRRTRIHPWTLLAAAASAAIAATGVWWIEHRLFPDPLGSIDLYTATAFPLIFLSVGVAGVLFIVIASVEKETGDEDREWWARAGGWLMIVAGGWLVTGAVVFLGPRLVIAAANRLSALRLTPAQAKTILGLITAISGGAAARTLGPGAGRHPSLTRRIIFAVTAPAFVVLSLVLLSWANYAATARLESVWWLHWYEHPIGAGVPETVALLVLLLSVGLTMGFFVNVNKFSLHGMYRNRLIRTFLGASRTKAERRPNPFTGFDPDDNLKMHMLKAVKQPLHVINTTLNVVATNRLAWQDRKAESFTISPLHCGSHCVAYRPSSEYGGAISLGTAMALSGAAVSPNQGAQSSPALAFLLTLFNVRLGGWLGNPGPAGGGRLPTWQLNDPHVGTLALFNELFGRTTDTNPYVYLSDGGHFDNLGLYEMVLRRCHYIVVSDAGCDGEYAFEDLGNALRKIRIDLGVPITFEPKIEMTKEGAGTNRNRHAAIATIDYRAVDGQTASQGVLVYIKATLTGNEPMDVVNYARAVPAFPHEATVNQWFGEAEFESYRALGLHSVDTIAGALAPDQSVRSVKEFYLAAHAYVGAPARAAGDVTSSTGA